MNLKILIILLLCVSNVALAFEDTTAVEPTEPEKILPFDGTFNVTTNYISEGVSNTNNSPAIQGGLTYTFKKSGIYFSAWGSNTDFIGYELRHGTVEFDLLAGIANDINDDWSYDFYFDQYLYPGTDDSDYMDIIGAITYKFLTLTSYYSINVYGSGGNGIYVNGAVNYEIPEKWLGFSDITALASVGHYTMPGISYINSYYDFMLGIQKIVKDFTLTLQWTDTAKGNQHPWDGYHVVGTVLYNF